MSWFRLDDKGAFHSKVLAAGNDAYGAWCRAGQWSSGHLTEGRIPRSTAFTIARQRIWDRLVEVGLCESLGDDGYQIHDFLDWNPSAEETLDRRAKRAEAGRAGGFKKAALAKQLPGKPPSNQPSKSLASASSDAWQKSAPIPIPIPIPEDPQNTLAGIPPPTVVADKPSRKRSPKPAKEPEIPIPLDFSVSAEVEEICRREGLPNPHEVLPDFRDWADEHQVRRARWESTFRRWMRGPITRRNYRPWSETEDRRSGTMPVAKPVEPEYGPAVPPPEGMLEALQAAIESTRSPLLRAVADEASTVHLRAIPGGAE